MTQTFIHLIKEPYLLLFLEYLHDPGRCLCNHYSNDIYHLSIVNKEVYQFMAKYKKLSKYSPEKRIESRYQKYFHKESYCLTHEIKSPLNLKHIDVVKSSIRNIINQNESHETFAAIIWENDFKMREYIHCETIEETEALKVWIQKNTKIFLSSHGCCSGRGFAITVIV
jgi:hypothetical protein